MASFRSQEKPYSRPSRGSANTAGQWLHDKAPTGPRKGRLSAPASVPVGPRAIVSPQTGPSAPNTKLLIENLHYEITPKDLTEIFGSIGTLSREPHVMYDRAGRSLGSAILTYDTPVEAIRAKKQYDGILAKGQPMSIKFYEQIPKGPRRATSTSTSTSTQPRTGGALINRVEKPSLAQRISTTTVQPDVSNARKTPNTPNSRPKPTQPRNLTGPIRSNKQGRRQPKKPKTAGELDMELDAFMGGGEPSTAEPPVANGNGDTEMAE